MDVDGVFSGCSTKFPCHIGWTKAAFELGFKFKRFAGNSGGALVAGMIAAGLDIDKIEKCTTDENFSRFVSSNWYSQWRWRKYGYLSDGRKFFKFLRKITERKKLADTDIELYTIGSNYSKKKMTIFSRETHPSMEIAEAIYISATMPGFFRPMIYGGDTFRDGLLHKDYPWDIWEDVPRKRIGHLIAFGNISTEVEADRWGGPDEFGAMAQQIAHKNVTESLRMGPVHPDGITVESDGMFMDSMHFDVPLRTKKLLIREGYKNAKRELKHFLNLHKNIDESKQNKILADIK